MSLYTALSYTAAFRPRATASSSAASQVTSSATNNRSSLMAAADNSRYQEAETQQVLSHVYDSHRRMLVEEDRPGV